MTDKNKVTDEEDISDDFDETQVVVVNSPRELFNMIQEMISGFMSPDNGGFVPLTADQTNITEKENEVSQPTYIDMWGPSFINEPRDVHMYNGQLTNIMMSVYDRLH
jgi:hypothetical protein